MGGVWGWRGKAAPLCVSHNYLLREIEKYYDGNWQVPYREFFNVMIFYGFSKIVLGEDINLLHAIVFLSSSQRVWCEIHFVIERKDILIRQL